MKQMRSDMEGIYSTVEYMPPLWREAINSEIEVKWLIAESLPNARLGEQNDGCTINAVMICLHVTAAGRRRYSYDVRVAGGNVSFQLTRFGRGCIVTYRDNQRKKNVRNENVQLLIVEQCLIV
jgi:hypothetical protein